MNKENLQSILDQTIEPNTQKKISELASIQAISESNGLLKIQLLFKFLKTEEKSMMRKFIEDILSSAGVEALVTIVTEESQNHQQQKKNTAVHQLIPLEIFDKFRNIIAVYSTKGGVGKSTIAVELAIQLSKQGLKTALIDLDVYGPSVPRILGIRDKVQVIEEKFIPCKIKGIDMMSVGSLIPEIDSPLIWRAAIVNGVIRQLFIDVEWEDNYDILILDMPPGTGDIPIAVGQSIPVDYILAVTTPHGISLEDTVKGISMFKKFNKNILGLIYNMGSVICPDCNKLIPIYQKNEEFSEILDKYDIEEIADLPMDPQVAFSADNGVLETISDDTLWKKEFTKILNLVKEKINL